MATTNTVSRREEAEKLKQRAKNYFTLSLLSFALPFAVLPVAAAVGAALGWMAATNQKDLNKKQSVSPLDKRFKMIEPKDGQITPCIYLGQAMDFIDYKDGLEAYQPTQHDLRGAALKERYDAEIFDSMESMFLSDDMQTRHAMLAGSTGVGKTEFLLSMLVQQLKRGGGAMIFDAKGEDALLAKINYLCEKFGRGDDLFFINPDRPHISHTYNCLLQGNVRQVISTTMKLTGKSKEEFFRNEARKALTAAIVCLQSQPNKPAFSFSDLAVLFSDIKIFLRLFKRIPTTPEFNDDREFVWAFLKNSVTYDREGEPMFNEQRYKEILSGLQTTMMDFSHTEYRKILNDYSPDIEMRQSILDNKIIVISVPALSDKEGASILGKLVLADVARAIGQLQSERNYPLVPYMVFLDEYGSIKDESHTDLFQLARSANIFLLLAVQAKSFLDDESLIFADKLLTNCWTHIYLDVRDPQTRENAAKLAGKTIRAFKTQTESSGAGYGNKNSETGAIRQESMSQSTSSGYKETREDILMPEDFTGEPGEAIIIGKYGTLKARLPIVEFAEDPPPVDEINLPYFEKPVVPGLDLMSMQLKNDKQLIDALSRRNS